MSGTSPASSANPSPESGRIGTLPGRSASLGFRVGLNAMLGLLALEFLVGMYVNLHVNVAPVSSIMAVFTGGANGYPSLLAHAGLGILLGLLGLLMIPMARRVRRGAVTAGAVVGWLGILLAAGTGAGFLALNHTNSSLAWVYSFLMALGFLVAFWAYAWIRTQLPRWS